MLKMKIGFKALALIFIGGALFFSPAHAIDIEKPLPKRSAKEVLLAGPSSAFFAEFDQAIVGDCEPLLSHLEKALNSGDSDRAYSAKLVYAEMYDRAICVPYDPTKSFEFFKPIAEQGYPLGNLHVGWKYLHGHGVKQSNELAIQAFKTLLVRIAGSPKTRTVSHLKDLLKGREFPDQVTKGIEWLNEISKSKEKQLKLAQNLINGTAKYYDGSSLPEDHYAAHTLLRDIADNSFPKGYYVLGTEILNGNIESYIKREGQMMLEFAAKCGYVDAVLAMAKFHEKGEHDFFQSDLYAYAWYHTAQILGINVDEEIKTLEQSFLQGEKESARQLFPWNFKPKFCQAD
jgi:TPR repeat protein